MLSSFTCILVICSLYVKRVLRRVLNKDVPFIRFMLFSLCTIIIGCKTQQSIGTDSDVGHLSEVRDNNNRHIRLDQYATGHLVLQVKVNGVPGIFLLDTGAGRSIVHRPQLNKFLMHSEDTGASVVSPGNARIAIHKSRGNQLTIGIATLNNWAFDLLDLNSVNRVFVNQGLDPIDGVIGADVLLRLNAIIDFRKMTLQIFPPDE